MFLAFVIISFILTALSLFYLWHYRDNQNIKLQPGQKFIVFPQSVSIILIACMTGMFLMLMFGAAIDKEDSSWFIYVFFLPYQFMCSYLSIKSSRFMIIYDNDKMIYRPTFGKTREYRFSQITKVRYILCDYIYRIGNRRIIINRYVYWIDLDNTYRKWCENNNVRFPISKLRAKQFSWNSGVKINYVDFIFAISVYLFSIVLFFPAALYSLYLKMYFCSAFLLFLFLFMLFSLIASFVSFKNPNKHPLLLKVCWGKYVIHYNDK